MIVKFLVLSVSIIYAVLIALHYNGGKIGGWLTVGCFLWLFPFNGLMTMNVVFILFAIVVIAILLLCLLLSLASSGSDHYPDIKDL